MVKGKKTFMRIRLLILGIVLGTGLLLSHCTSFMPAPEKTLPYEAIQSLYHQGEYQAMLDTVQALEPVFPGESLLYYYAGLGHLRLGDVHPALQSYRQASKLAANPHMDSLYSAILGQNTLELYHENSFQAANSLADSTLTVDKTNHDAYFVRYMIKGRNLLEKGSKWQIWDAIVAFGNAAQMHPDDPMPHYFMAKSYFKKDDKDFDNIIQEYEEALKRDPPADLVPQIKKDVSELRRRKKLYEDFWGK